MGDPCYRQCPTEYLLLGRQRGWKGKGQRDVAKKLALLRNFLVDHCGKRGCKMVKKMQKNINYANVINLHNLHRLQNPAFLAEEFGLLMCRVL